MRAYRGKTYDRLLGGSSTFARPCRCALLVRAAVKATAAPSKHTQTPNIVYSTTRVNISIEELRLLYKKVYASHGVTGSPTKQSCFRHWGFLCGDQADDKLQLLLTQSVAVVAAYTRDPAIVYDESSREASTAGGSMQEADGADGSWLRWDWRRPRKLVGFARAAGDLSLVATIHDVLVHPDMQGYGLGSVMIRRLLNQIATQGVYDVGLVTPTQLQSFFHSCAFEPDREGSVPMALHQHWHKEEHETNAPIQGNPALAQLLDTALERKLTPRTVHAQLL